MVKRENVVAGTLMLSISSIFVRLIGFWFRVHLSGDLGAEGMGLYSLIISVYGLCTTVAVSGISTAISKLAAEQLALGNRGGARQVLRRALGFALVLSITVAVVLFFSAEYISVSMLKDPRCTLALKLMAPGMPFLAVSACLRGYFLAERQMTNPAVGQVLEQISKMVFIFALITPAMQMGIEFGCALVVLGMSLGEVICFIFSFGGYIHAKRKYKSGITPPLRGISKGIFRIAAPISLGAYVRSGLRLLEDILIVEGFRTYSAVSFGGSATETYGLLRGMAMPLLIFPLSLLSAFVTTLTPEIARLGAKKTPLRLENAISMILRYTCVIGIFIVFMFTTFSQELGTVIYKSEEVGEIVRQLAFLIPFMCIETVVVGILHGLDQQMSSLRYNIGDCVLRIGLAYFLVPRFGVAGFMGMVVFSNLFTSLLNLRRLVNVTKLHLKWREWIFQPMLAAMAAGQGCKALYKYLFLGRLSMRQGLLVGLCLMGGLYLVALYGVGSLRTGDFSWIIGRISDSPKPPRTEPRTGEI